MRINVDVGEGFPWDAELAAHADMLNVCAGAHAGSPEISRATVALAKENGAAWGIHPGYPDRLGFGRRSLAEFPIDDLEQNLSEQTSRLIEIGGATYIKPHGAFYHDSQISGVAADALGVILTETKLPLVGFPGSFHAVIASQVGVEFWSEGFAERGYDAQGKLLPRSQPGAILIDREEIQSQARSLDVDTICIHGDSPHCAEVMAWLREIWPR